MPKPCIQFGLGFEVRPFLEVDGHVEGLTGEQIQPEAHVLALADVTAYVDGQGVDEIVDDAPKVNQVAEEEGKPFDALLLSKGWEPSPSESTSDGKVRVMLAGSGSK